MAAAPAGPHPCPSPSLCTSYAKHARIGCWRVRSHQQTWQLMLIINHDGVCRHQGTIEGSKAPLLGGPSKAFSMDGPGWLARHAAEKTAAPLLKTALPHTGTRFLRGCLWRSSPFGGAVSASVTSPLHTISCVCSARQGLLHGPRLNWAAKTRGHD